MENTILEQELAVRIFVHKTAILKAYLTEQYVKEQTTGDLCIPEFQARNVANEIIPMKVQKYLEVGKFEPEYLNAYEALKDRLPDNFSVCL